MSHFFLSFPDCHKNIFTTAYAQWIRMMIHYAFDLSAEQVSLGTNRSASQMWTAENLGW